jgi:signal transduction histidine kinase/CRP-like cAMP-binding protein
MGKVRSLKTAGTQGKTQGRPGAASSTPPSGLAPPAQALLKLVKGTQLLGGLPQSTLVPMVSRMRQRRLAPGAVLVRQGEPALALYFLAAGRLEVSVRGGDPEAPPVGTIEPRQWFGELAVLTRRPRTATVTAATESEIWSLSRKNFEGLLAEYPALARNVIDALCARIQQKDQEFLAQSTLAIERARLVRQLQERNATLAALSEVAQAISASLDLGRTLETIVQRARTVTGAVACVLYEVDPVRQLLAYLHGAGLPDNTLSSCGEGVLGRAVQERQVVWAPDLETDSGGRLGEKGQPHCRAAGVRSVIAAPIIIKGEAFGAVAVYREDVHQYSPEEVQFVSVFADHAGIAMENARLFRDVEEKARQLEVVSQHKSRFLASMSHELRTPLNAIIGFSEVLLDTSLGSLPAAEQHEFLTNILTSGKHLLRLINDILDLSKIEAGKMEVHCEAVDVAEIIEGVLATVKPLAMKKRIQVTSGEARGLSPVWADPPRLKQILYNLLSNAIKFTPEGGRVAVTARRVEEPQGRRGAEAQRRGETSGDSPQPLNPSAPRQFLEVSVTDTGIGIPPEDLERVFGEFEQVTDRAHLRQEGTGLGLALVRRLVALHGGTIRVASTPGQGSIFTFTIPVAPGDAPAVSVLSQPSGEGGVAAETV